MSLSRRLRRLYLTSVRLGREVGAAATRVFSPVRDEYPTTGTQPLTGDLARNRRKRAKPRASW